MSAIDPLLYSDKRKNVVIIGAGAAGMSCAATLAQHPDRFKVTIMEKMKVTGGQATSIYLDREKYGTHWMNNGVQGGSLIFKHTFNYFRKHGHEPQEVKLQVSFGKGSDGFWTNCFPSNLVHQFSADIKKFGKVLKIIQWTLPILGVVPVSTMLRLFHFSKDFGDKMVFPLIALFLGTGNQTANVSCAILERLFNDPNMKLWDYNPDTLLPNLPIMVTFPNLHDFYEDWRKDLEAMGVNFQLQTDVMAITRRSNEGVTLQTRLLDTEANKGNDAQREPTVRMETFDELVFCILADDALRLLGKSATWRERFILGSAKFFDDITVTHSDGAYIRKHYETKFSPSLCAKPNSKSQEDQIAFSMGERRGSENELNGFRPMYYTKTYAEDPSKIEMSFDCTNYQHQFRLGQEAEVAPKTFDQHVFQTIFLDKNKRHLWTIDEIDKSKIIESKWWHQLGHRWQHYLRVVPCMMFINGRNHTLFAGSWTLVNMHELACISGIAAAYRLGADYVEFDEFAKEFFSKFLLLSHGVSYKGEEERRRKKKKKKTS